MRANYLYAGVADIYAETGDVTLLTALEKLWRNLVTYKMYITGGIRVDLVQETQYPFAGDISIQVNSSTPSTFAIHLRIPDWATRAQLCINATPYSAAPVPGTYLKLERQWSAGDVITLQLDMPPQLIEAHPLVKETRSQLAVQRGPMIYCVESLDLPQGASITDLRIRPGMALTVASDLALDRLMPGIKVLRGKAFLAETGSAWLGSLYRPLQPRPLKEIEVNFIPYFAWDNRGASEMTVWIPAL